jgi:hypothetical protein
MMQSSLLCSFTHTRNGSNVNDGSGCLERPEVMDTKKLPECRFGHCHWITGFADGFGLRPTPQNSMEQSGLRSP